MYTFSYKHSRASIHMHNPHSNLYNADKWVWTHDWKRIGKVVEFVREWNFSFKILEFVLERLSISLSTF